jgi:hypothetical protein
MRIKHTKIPEYGSIAVAYPETFCESWYLSRRKGWTHKIDMGGHDYYSYLSPNAVRENNKKLHSKKHKMGKDY